MTSVAIILLVLASAWVADRSVASVALNDGSYILLIRHGDAPGRSEPAGFNLNDCSTQRGLSEKGRDEARNLGVMLRAAGVNVMRVMASRFCRAHETAQLLKLGPVENAPAFDDLAFNKSRKIELLDGERQLIASWRGPGVLLVVSHGSNIKALTGMAVAQGAMVVVSQKQDHLIAKPFSVSLETAATLN